MSEVSKTEWNLVAFICHKETHWKTTNIRCHIAHFLFSGQKSNSVFTTAQISAQEQAIKYVSKNY